MDKLKDFFTKPIYKSIKVWHLFLVIIVIAAASGGGNNESSNNESSGENKEAMTLQEANNFMKEHAKGGGFELIDSKEISIDDMNLYVFLTKIFDASGMMYCVTTVSKIKAETQDEFKNAILNTDCGRSEKVAQWKNL